VSSARLGVALLLFAACGSTPEPSVPAVGNVFRVDLREQHFGTIAAYVHDDAGVVLAVAKAETPPPFGRDHDEAVTDVGTSSMLVTWLGGACRFGPTVTLTGDSEELIVTIQPEAGEGLPQGLDCNAIGLFFAIKLTLARPVDQQAVTVRVVR
jgi:hypothetical protein